MSSSQQNCCTCKCYKAPTFPQTDLHLSVNILLHNRGLPFVIGSLKQCDASATFKTIEKLQNACYEYSNTGQVDDGVIDRQLDQQVVSHLYGILKKRRKHARK